MNQVRPEEPTENGHDSEHHAYRRRRRTDVGGQAPPLGPTLHLSNHSLSQIEVHHRGGTALVVPGQAQAEGRNGHPRVPTPATASRWQRLGLGRLMRRTLALGLVGVALWWLAIPLFFPVTSDAVVNARLVQVRAPIDATTTELRHDLGDAVDAGQPLARLVNYRADAAHLSLLKTKHAEVLARSKRLRAELGEVVRSEAIFRATARRYQAGRVAVLEAGVKEASALIDVARHQHTGTNILLRRSQGLAGRNAAAVSEVDVATENESVARKRIEQWEAALAKTRTELTAASEGLFLQSETPYFLQRAEELALKAPVLAANLTEARDLLAALETELKREGTRIAAMSGAVLASPVRGIVWNCQHNLGQVVKQNETIYEVADGDTVFVEALLHQRHLASVEPGATATILLTGGATFNGRVRAVRTSGPSDSESSFALKLASGDMKQVRVLIDFESGAATADLIGRHARVLVTTAEPGMFDGALAWVFARMGG